MRALKINVLSLENPLVLPVIPWVTLVDENKQLHVVPYEGIMRQGQATERNERALCVVTLCKASIIYL